MTGCEFFRVFIKRKRLVEEISLHQIRQIPLDIPHHGWAGLGNAADKPVLLNVVDIAPGGDIGAEGDADDPVYAELFQLAEDFQISVRIVGGEGRRHQQGNLFSGFQIFKETLRIVGEIPGVMLADIIKELPEGQQQNSSAAEKSEKQQSKAIPAGGADDEMIPAGAADGN